ncbi:E3 ubiquitin-protein ligase RHF2A-like [Panicum miliaceum]|uniref:E3 ubiquitin-protein ligase RHF2A-like n=1 Tax=Panicum miliaceum TaxID=4540 RepID=A0A3L6TC65_PANMI|nr:E3 ubiquitin-protein ligase RHF2A-like [Panicum miliaceum]
MVEGGWREVDRGGMEAKAARMEELSAAAAFVEASTQDTYDDAATSASRPSPTATPPRLVGAKEVPSDKQHEGPYETEILLYQCIDRTLVFYYSLVRLEFLAYCSQELLEAVEEEQNVQGNHAPTTTIFRHPLLGDFEVPVDADDAKIKQIS